jgi:hypothetical protein
VILEPKTIFEKIWDNHVVTAQPGVPSLIYIDLHLCHEVTTPQAFQTLRDRGLKVRRPDLTIATMDHSTPTTPHNLPILNGNIDACPYPNTDSHDHPHAPTRQHPCAHANVHTHPHPGSHFDDYTNKNNNSYTHYYLNRNENTRALEYAQRAEAALGGLPISDWREALIGLARYAVERQS